MNYLISIKDSSKQSCLLLEVTLWNKYGLWTQFHAHPDPAHLIVSQM